MFSSIKYYEKLHNVLFAAFVVFILHSPLFAQDQAQLPELKSISVNSDSTRLYVSVLEGKSAQDGFKLIGKYELFEFLGLNADNLSLRPVSTDYLKIDSLGLFLKSNTVYDYETLRFSTKLTIPIVFESSSIFQSNILDTIQVELVDRNEKPIFTKSQLFIDDVSENTLDTLKIGAFQFYDPDSAQTVSFQLRLNNSLLSQSVDFLLVSDTLVLLPSDLIRSTFNYEINPHLDFHIELVDSEELSTSFSFSINVSNLPEAPYDIELSKLSAYENAPKSYILSDINIRDEDFNEDFSIDLLSVHDAFSVHLNNDIFKLVVNDSSFFDFEQFPILEFQLKVTDKDSLSFEKDFSFYIQNVNESPSIVFLDSLIELNEDHSYTTEVYISDPESPNNQLNIELESSNRFLIRPIDLSLLPKDSSMYNLIVEPINNANGSSTIRLKVSDYEFETFDDLPIHVLPINDKAIVDIDTLIVLESMSQPIDNQLIKLVDIDNSLSDLSLKITSLPEHGVLRFQDKPIDQVPFHFEASALFLNKFKYEHNGQENFQDYFIFDLIEPEGQLDSLVLPIQIRPKNDPPIFINRFFPVYLNEDENIDISFTIYDDDSPLNQIKSTAISSNNGLFSTKGLEIDGVDKVRLLRISPEENTFGHTTITLWLDDGYDSTEVEFDVQITPINDPPKFELKNRSFRINAAMESKIMIPYSDPDSKARELNLAVGSLNSSFIDENTLEIEHDSTNSRFILNLSPRNFYRDYTQVADLLLELSDLESASALQISVQLEMENEIPQEFQLLRANSLFDSDSLEVEFEWTTAIDPENDPVRYSVFIQSSERDTIIHGLRETNLKLVNKGFFKPNTRYDWWVKASDNANFDKNKHRDSTVTKDVGQFVTPNFSQMYDWVEFASIYPNPFRRATQISYTIQTEAFIELSVFDSSGRKIDIIEQGFHSKGTYMVTWTPSNLNTGLYICQLVARQVSDGRSLIKSKKISYIP